MAYCGDGFEGKFLHRRRRALPADKFHFHRPCEQCIHGKPYDMGLHLMHKSSDGKVAGVAVLLQAGSANATIQQLWQPMPMSEGKEQEIAGVDIQPAVLRPRGAAYSMYLGSLTAPPSTEGIPWFVLKSPMEMSLEQINAFANFIRTICDRFRR